MMTVLCFDTSGPHCSVALAVGERIFTHNEHLVRRHNEALLGILDDLFKQAEISPTKVDLIGLTTGPGSFTGIRLGAAVAQALALAADAAVVRIPTHQVLYQAAKERGCTGRIACSIKSRGQLYYVCGYDQDGLRQPMELTDEMPSWIVDAEPEYLVGERPTWWEAGQVAVVADPPDAEVMLALTKTAHREGHSLPPSHALPEYFEGDSPWRKQNAKA